MFIGILVYQYAQYAYMPTNKKIESKVSSAYRQIYQYAQYANMPKNKKIESKVSLA